MSGALAVVIAAVFAGACIAVAVRARSALKALAPPGLAASERATSPELAQIESERRSALLAMGLLLLRFRSAARIALAAGTASGLLALAGELGRNLPRAMLSACACFALGALAAVVVAQLGHLARRDSRRFRDEWQRQVRESTRALEASASLAEGERPQTRSSPGEWTDPRGAG